MYHGSSTGLATSAAWTAESDQASADFAFSVAGAGDVNGDGYSDVIVGAHLFDNVIANRGRALVYLGSASGLATAASWTAESSQSSSEFGISVAAAGDVNGDGYGDVIVGSSLYDNGQTNEGRAFVYYGNGGPGLPRIPNQFKLNGAPLALLGKSDSSTSFHLHALGITSAGRGKVRLEWEVKPLGTAFNGTGIGQGSLVDTGFPGASGSVAALDEAVTGLTSGTVYKWRLRIASGNPYFQHSAWFSLPNNGRTESDLRTP